MLRLARTRLADARARAIAVDAAGADVDEALRYNSRLRQRGDQPLRARIVAPARRRRREVQDRERRGAQPVQTVERIEVADDRNDAVAAQLRNVLRTARQAVEPHPTAQKIGGAQRDVAATDQQDPDHRQPGVQSAANVRIRCHTRLP